MTTTTRRLMREISHEDPWIATIDGVLSPAECRELIQRTERAGYGEGLMKRVATRLSAKFGKGFSLASLKRIYGSNWSYQWREFIMQLPPADLACPF